MRCESGRVGGRCRGMAGDEAGFTILELLVVLTIIGVLLAIAVPSFLRFEQKASVATAESNLRSALPAVSAFHNDHHTYDAAVMTVAALRAYDQGLASGFAVVSGSATSYCVTSTHNGARVYKDGPGAPITSTACT